MTVSGLVGRLFLAGGPTASAFCLLLVLPPGWASAQSGEISGLITELHRRHGSVEVQIAGATEWRAAAPLLALRPGDTIRVTQDASVVVMLTHPSGSIKIEAATSPFTVPPLPAREGAVQRGAALIRNILTSLAATRPDAVRVKVETRGEVKLPVIVSPRNGPILPGAIDIEWSGPPELRYTVTILNPSGVRIQRRSIQGLAFAYPADGPPLTPGIRYRVQVTTGNLPPEEAWFEILEPARVEALLHDIGELHAAMGADVPPSSLAVIRAAFLAEGGLLHDARGTILIALKTDPKEPTLHLVLGSLYQRSGLEEQATESFRKATLLTQGSGR